MTGSLNKPAFSKNNGSKTAFSKNNNNKLASGKNNGNNEINRFGIGRNNMEYIKSGKLSNSGKLKSKKTSKF